VGATRKVAHSQEAEHEGNQCVPAVARCGTGDGKAEADCGVGCYGGAGVAWVKFPHHAGTWEGTGGCRTAADYRNSAPFGDFAGTDG